MFEKLSSKQEFNPTKLGIWVNPCYLIRRTISQAIRENAFHLKGKILDYGCGSRPYEAFFDATEYVGVDLEASGHPSDRKKADIFFDGTYLPFAENEFDGVIASEVFEHVFNLQVCLKEIHRVLKPGGRLLITCPFVWQLHEEPYDFARYTPYALTMILERAGFKILIIEQKGTPVEVIGQMFIHELLPSIFRPIRRRPFRRLHSLLNATITGLVFGTCSLLARFSTTRNKLYLSNVLVVEKTNLVPTA